MKDKLQKFEDLNDKDKVAVCIKQMVEEKDVNERRLIALIALESLVKLKV